MFMNGWKQTAKRWKLHFRDYQKSIKKNNSIEHLQRQQFSFTKTNEYLIVSKNPQVFTSKLKLYVLSRRFPGVGCSRQEDRSKLPFYSQNYNWIFFGKFFLSIYGELISTKGFLKFCKLKLISNLIRGQISVSVKS